MIDYAVRRLDEECPDEVREIIGTDVLLVPAPRNAPFPPKQAEALWVPKRICEALRARGLGSAIFTGLVREQAVPKSAFAPVGGRPSPRRHYQTMRCEKLVSVPQKITVVDDVITKGATLLAAASLAQEAHPQALVRGLRAGANDGPPPVEKIVEPVVGTVKLTAFGEADRQP